MKKKIIVCSILLVLIVTGVVIGSYFYNRVTVNGSTTVAIRIGTDSSEKFIESISEVPVGEKSSVSITTVLQSNREKKKTCKIEVMMEKSEIIDYDKVYITGVRESSINISDDKKKITYEADVSKNTSATQIKLIFNFVALDEGSSRIVVTVYDPQGDVVLSACSEQIINFG